jgi:hypothetical protein
MRTLKLTHEEIDMIDKLLNKEYNDQLKFIKDRHHMITPVLREHLLDNANRYADLQSQIANSDKDV